MIRNKRLARRRGKSRAIVAIGNSIITAVYNMLANGVCYEEPPLRNSGRANADRTRQRAIKDLSQLGFKVTITRTQAA